MGAFKDNMFSTGELCINAHIKKNIDKFVGTLIKYILSLLT